MTSTPPSPRHTRGLVLDDLVASLHWPMLLRAAGLALRPSHLGLAAVLLVLVAIVARAPALWLDGPGPAAILAQRGSEGLRDVHSGVLEFDYRLALSGLRQTLLEAPAAAVRVHPWSTLAIILPLLLTWGIVGGAISRSAATEFSLHTRSSWTGNLAFALSRWHSFGLVKVGPLLALGAAWLLLAVVGLLLGVKFVQVGAAVVYPLGLAIALGCVILLAAFLVTLHMLVPAVACEGTDAIDATQRCFAYAIGRPLRLALYAAILIIQGVVIAALLSYLVEHAVRGCAWAATTWVNDSTADLFREHAAHPSTVEARSASEGLALRLVGFWSSLLRLAVGAFVVSFWFCAGTLQYLVMRRACDGQDVEELWTPGAAPAGAIPADVPEGDDADYT